MSSARYVHWQDHGMWLGYFEEFPDYMTQGETLEQLQENLRDLYTDLASGQISQRFVHKITRHSKRAAWGRPSSFVACLLAQV
jgi:hypothetical protein